MDSEALDKLAGVVAEGGCDFLIMRTREQTRYRKLLNYRVLIANGLESLWMHRIQMDGAEVLALAKWLVIRMCNRFAVAAVDGQTAQTKKLAAKISGKLLEHGPLTVRELTRKCSRLKAGDCQKALQWLEGRRIVGCEQNHWGIIADTEVVGELLRRSQGRRDVDNRQASTPSQA